MERALPNNAVQQPAPPQQGGGQAAPKGDPIRQELQGFLQNPAQGAPDGLIRLFVDSAEAAPNSPYMKALQNPPALSEDAVLDRVQYQDTPDGKVALMGQKDLEEYGDAITQQVRASTILGLLAQVNEFKGGGSPKPEQPKGVPTLKDLKGGK